MKKNGIDSFFPGSKSLKVHIRLGILREIGPIDFNLNLREKQSIALLINGTDRHLVNLIDIG